MESRTLSDCLAMLPTTWNLCLLDADGNTLASTDGTGRSWLLVGQHRDKAVESEHYDHKYKKATIMLWKEDK